LSPRGNLSIVSENDFFFKELFRLETPRFEAFLNFPFSAISIILLPAFYLSIAGRKLIAFLSNSSSLDKGRSGGLDFVFNTTPSNSPLSGEEKKQSIFSLLYLYFSAQGSLSAMGGDQILI